MRRRHGGGFGAGIYWRAKLGILVGDIRDAAEGQGAGARRRMRSRKSRGRAPAPHGGSSTPPEQAHREEGGASRQSGPSHGIVQVVICRQGAAASRNCWGGV